MMGNLGREWFKTTGDNSEIDSEYFSKNILLMSCAIWYHLYKLKNVKSTHGGVLLLNLLLVNLHTKSFTKSNTPPRVFSMFFKLYKCYQITQNVRYTLYRAVFRTLANI